eukprot:10395492-Heterocapsa_arctica.AAC.1
MEDTYSSRRAHFEAQAAAMDLQQEVGRKRPRWANLGKGDTYYAPGEHAPGQLDLGKVGKGKG